MLIQNPLDIKIPDYLNKEFFVNAIEEGLREIKITVKEVIFEWGSNPGDNYCSAIYRVIVKFERYSEVPIGTEKLSLIVKTVPVTEGTQFLEHVGVFIKEKLTYTDILPRLEILANEKFCAKYYYSIKAPIQTIVFNDLKVEGFVVAPRQQGLDWPHCKLILEQLGKFHGSSMVLAKRDPDILPRLRMGMLSPDVFKTDTFLHMFGGCLEQLIRVSAHWPNFGKISKKLQHYFDNFNKIFSQCGMPKKGDRIIVLNHGDLWTTNFMYAYDDKTKPKIPTRALFVDFQLSFYGSPACDLNFFLNTSVQLDLIKNRRDDLINVYYKSLVSTLEDLRYDSIPTLDDLKYELRSRELYGLFALFGFLPIITMPKELSEDSSIDKLMDPEYKRKKYEAIFAIEELKQHMMHKLKRLDDIGALDDY